MARGQRQHGSGWAQNPYGGAVRLHVVACLEQVTRSSATLPLASLATAPYPHAWQIRSPAAITAFASDDDIASQFSLRQGEFCDRIQPFRPTMGACTSHLAFPSVSGLHQSLEVASSRH